MSFLASPRLTKVRRGALLYLAMAVELVFVVGVGLLSVAYLTGAFEVREVTHGVSGNGCGIGTKVIESGEVRCLPPPGHPVVAP